MNADAVYAQWAQWLVDIGAPWDMKPKRCPPPKVLAKMPQLLFDDDNRYHNGEIIHPDVAVADYRLQLEAEWGCET